MAKQDERTLRRRIAVIEYDDGRVEELNIGKPMYEYQVSRIGVDPVEDQTQAGFWTLWFAAGKPGANGGELTQDSARPLMESWLATIQNTEFRIEDAEPPPTRRGTSRTSAA